MHDYIFFYLVVKLKSMGCGTSKEQHSSSSVAPTSQQSPTAVTPVQDAPNATQARSHPLQSIEAAPAQVEIHQKAVSSSAPIYKGDASPGLLITTIKQQVILLAYSFLVFYHTITRKAAD